MIAIIDSKTISTKTTSLEEIEKLPVVDRILSIEDLPEMAVSQNADSNLQNRGDSNERRNA